MCQRGLINNNLVTAGKICIVLLSLLIIASLFTACNSIPVTTPAPTSTPVPTISAAPTLTPQETPKMPITENVKWLAAVIVSEAGSTLEKGKLVRCTDEERAAVGWTVINRLYSGVFGRTIKDIVNAPGQYAHDQQPTSEILLLAQKILEGRIQDPTGGATYFFSPRGMPKEGESTTGFDTGGGLHSVPGIDGEVYFPSWTLTLTYIGDLKNVRVAYFMFYRAENPGTTTVPN
jgi:hypothetical protein